MLLVASTAASVAEAPHSLHSFHLPLWTVTGDASIYADFVRLVPDRQSKRGAFWDMKPVEASDWEVEFDFRIFGVSPTGADGIAFWYAKEPAILGSLFGNKELFSGLGVIVDTYDNDKMGTHPYVFGLVNDGTYRFTEQEHDHRDHTAGTEGKEAAAFGELNGCTFRMRNGALPSSLKVTYLNKELKVQSRLNPSAEWKQCFTIQNLVLSPGGFFGFSAATGDLADNHDIHNVTVTFLDNDAIALDSADLTAQDKYRTELSRMQHNLQQELSLSIEPVKKASGNIQTTLTSAVDTVRELVTSIGTQRADGSLTALSTELDGNTKTLLAQINTHTVGDGLKTLLDTQRRMALQLERAAVAGASTSSLTLGVVVLLVVVVGLAVLLANLYATLRKVQFKKMM
eukprot:TRINITY_DN18298_c0_g1_i1.p1 TRINITY_DN18298_c0_g1~~TRINITY_DN18298_c0_g1_i1.p1  ORF type:complete len:420 (+),score=144.79 TRINITY_DN18298_c0_g1_i1:63-1262(+)